MEGPPKSDIVHRELDTTLEEPAVQIAEIVAELEDESPTELVNMYGCIDGVLDNVFSTPPSPEAQLQIEFSYEGYRVTVDQDGTARFLKTG